METQHNVLQAHLQAWLDAKGDRKKRGELTNTLSNATKLHPKSIGRSMRTLQCKSKRKPKKKRGRRRYYDKAVDACIHEVWTCMECPCAEVMHPMIGVYITSFERAGAWHHDDEATGKFRAVSLGTLKNRVGAFRKKEGTLRGYSATKPSTVTLCIPTQTTSSSTTTYKRGLQRKDMTLLEVNRTRRTTTCALKNGITLSLVPRLDMHALMTPRSYHLSRRYHCMTKK